MRAVSIALVILVAPVLAGCAESPPPATNVGACAPPAFDGDAEAWRAERPRARLTTNLGDILVELDLERAPTTAQNFIDLVEDGFYDGVHVHRVVPGFVIQAGDPLSKDDDPENDGTGGPGYEIPDEFNPSLRHDTVGVLSMANSGPDTGGSQFFITLGATPHLDDRHSVFGRVADGESLGVVQEIGSVPTNERDRPTEPVVIERAEMVEPAVFEETHAVDVHPVIAKKTTEPGRTVNFAVVVKNMGSTRDAPTFSATVPEGWTCTIDAHPTIPAGTARVVFLAITPPAGAGGTATVDLRVESLHSGVQAAEARVDVEVGELGEPVRNGDSVVANYAGLLPDGRLFDTSMEDVATDDSMPKFETLRGYQPRPSYSTFEFTVGSGVIPGFTNLALTAKEGETVTALIPAADAYAQGDVYQRPLTGRDLVFELEIVEARG